MRCKVFHYNCGKCKNRLTIKVELGEVDESGFDLKVYKCSNCGHKPTAVSQILNANKIINQ